MKHNLRSIGIVLFFLVMLLFPKAVFDGASSGLLLWYQIVLPTLFPFLLISNLLLSTGSLKIISSLFGKIVSYIFRVSENGSFAVLTGFLCGYPMGAKTTADLVIKGYISENEGKYLLSFCNNCSPAFILNYVVWKTFDQEKLIMPTMIILMFSPFIVSLFTRRIYKVKNTVSRPMKVVGKSWNFSDIDNSIMDGFETLIKVGGYIMLFSVLVILLKQFPVNNRFFLVILSSLEITNGIQMIGRMSDVFEVKYLLALALSAFGGWCSIAQTKCVVQKAGLSILPYTIEKLAAAFTASLLGLVYLCIVRGLKLF